MTEPPRNDVLAERIDNLAATVAALNQRMDGLATEKTLIALIEGRDRVFNAQLKAMQDDVNEIAARQSTERAERIAADEKEAQARKSADKENEDRASKARTFALSAIGLVVTVVVGLVALINQIGGAPA